MSKNLRIYASNFASNFKIQFQPEVVTLNEIAVSFGGWMMLLPFTSLVSCVKFIFAINIVKFSRF